MGKLTVVEPDEVALDVGVRIRDGIADTGLCGEIHDDGEKPAAPVTRTAFPSRTTFLSSIFYLLIEKGRSLSLASAPAYSIHVY